MNEYKNDIFAHKINGIIKQTNKEQETFDINNISDGYHTFGELYKHRIHLFIALCRILLEKNVMLSKDINKIIKSKKHFNGSEMEGWFIIQIETKEGQISYHLPNKYWDECRYIDIIEKANEWDGHTSDDVLDRLLLI